MQAKFVVLGLGATGQSCVRYFQQRGTPFAAMDSRDLPPGLAQLREDCPGAELYLGGFDPGVLASAQCLIVSPGVPL
ncbi:MAG: UDP-N-acetylmuramoyl-L-alanine--D-glutamate ligase, partial [Halieaceae bacterium]|nr:UDP-N-acetylmuramoyl-L-alanine--D-glutamate ligase [Halieaceae bacterium]